MNKYKIHENYSDNENLRNEFFNLVSKVFPSVDFKEWYSRGFWLDSYIPVSIVKDNKILSNVSITNMKILIKGEYLNGIQVGTVATLPEYRKQGLSRILMEYVLNKFKDSADIFFLFANDSVLNYYPKFGFKRYNEVVFKSESNIPDSNYSARQLNIQSSSDFSLLQKLLKERQILTTLFGAVEYDFITLWYVLNFFSRNLFYLKEDDTIFIITKDKDKLHIWDIIYTKPIDIVTALSKVIPQDGVKCIHYYFSPDQLNFDYDSVEIDDDSPLFVRGDFVLEKKHFMFPYTART
ncbi:GNAT family N-acetyltransferase [Bacteroidota bacterium]